MDKAKKKHLKALRRQKKLEKREANQLPEAPFRLVIEPFEFGTRLKGFEEAALANLSPGKIVRELWTLKRVRDVFRDITARSNNAELDNALHTIIGVIVYDICLLGGAVPPFFVPAPYDLVQGRDGKLNFVFRIFRPQKVASEGGSLYHYFWSKDIGGKPHEVWFTSHSLDRVKERLDLGALDTCAWMRILSPGSAKFWEDIDGKYLCHKIHGMYKEKPILLPIFFPYEIKDGKIMCMTCLTPASNTPEVKPEPDWPVVSQEDFIPALEETRKMLRRVGLPDLHRYAEPREAIPMPVRPINYAKKQAAQDHATRLEKTPFTNDGAILDEKLSSSIQADHA